MIITSERKLEPNKIYTEKDFNKPFENAGQMIYKFSIFVIREATLEEFRNNLIERYGKEKENEFINYEYFYEIHTD